MLSFYSRLATVRRMRLVLLLLFLVAVQAHGARTALTDFLARKDLQSRTYVFHTPKTIAAIQQRNGAHDFVLTGNPARSAWQWSRDGKNWTHIPGTSITNDARLLRLHSLQEPIQTKYLRLQFDQGLASGDAIFDSKSESRDPERFILVVNSTHDSKLPGHGQEFIPLVRSIPGWETTRAQQVWVPDFNSALVKADPKPIAVFFSGSFKDWCEVDRSHWRGVEDVLKKETVPMWASCGGAQAFAILAETGTAKPWDCPHCRDARAPKLPIYTHIGHTADPKACGDYATCIFERGPHNVRITNPDPIFAGLPPEFQIMQSHCGQIEFPPRGWELIATAGADSKTKVQCMKRKGVPIYAAQFHIEMEGTPESSRTIMSNFLQQAHQWRSIRR
jgi:hypothetical protein